MSPPLIFSSGFDLSVSYLVFKIIPLVWILYIFETNLSYTVFLTASLFTTLLSLLTSAGTINLSMPILSTSAFKLVKSDFAARLDISTHAAFFKSVFVA